MTNPTPQTTDAAQFSTRFGDVKDALDAVRDALLNAGPSLDEHKQALAKVGSKDKTFFMDACLMFANYVNNQAGELDQYTLDAVVAFVGDHRDAADAAHKAGADVLSSSLERLEVAARVSGLAKWTDHTPDDDES